MITGVETAPVDVSNEPKPHDEPTAGAGATGLASYAAGRSAALLLFPRPHQVDVGSSTCIRIDGRFFLATAGHNIEDLAHDAQIKVLAAGSERPLPFVGRNSRRFEGSATVDVAWIELHPEAARRSRLEFLALSQIARGRAPKRDAACFVQGFPSAMVTVRDDATVDVDPSPMGFLTRPIAASARGARHQPGIDFAVEYAAHDGGAARALPNAPGLSGGGMWRVTLGPERARLVAITRTWFSGRRELCGTAIEHWLRLVHADFPDLRRHLDEALER